MIRINISLD